MDSLLLENHNPTPNTKPLKHVRRKKCLPRPETAISLVLRIRLLIKQHRSLDLKELGAEKCTFWRQSPELRKRSNTVIVSVLHRKPTGREGQEEHPEE